MLGKSRGKEEKGGSSHLCNPPQLSLGGECFLSLLGKIHVFCMVDVNKKEILCILELRGNVKSDIFFLP